MVLRWFGSTVGHRVDWTVHWLQTSGDKNPDLGRAGASVTAKVASSVSRTGPGHLPD